MIIGGFHGNEPATTALVREFPIRPGIALLPLLNPDGALEYTRYNANGIDLNRNFSYNWSDRSEEPSGPEPWSEPESLAIRDAIECWRPSKIITLHWALGELDADGPQSIPLAEAMWKSMTKSERAPYRIRVPEPGYEPSGLDDLECPGSLGQWLGYGVSYPDGTRPAVVTLELPFDPTIPRPEVLPFDHWEQVQARWKADSAGYLAAARPAVMKMLEAACALHL